MYFQIVCINATIQFLMTYVKAVPINLFHMTITMNNIGLIRPCSLYMVLIPREMAALNQKGSTRSRIAARYRGIANAAFIVTEPFVREEVSFDIPRLDVTILKRKNIRNSAGIIIK